MSKKLVAYFSASGVTANAAKALASAANASIYEIKPKIPYTNADLDWRNSKSRSSLEMKDKTSRPQLADNNANIAVYDTIFIGFPIWFWTCPKAVTSFISENNLKGKTIYPFCTSGGIQIDEAVDEIKRTAEGATVKKGKRFRKYSEDALIKWLEQ